MLARPFPLRSALALALLTALVAAGVGVTSAHAATTGTVTIGSASFPLSGTNVYRAADTLVLFTPAAGSGTPTNVYGAEAVVVGGLVTALFDRQSTGVGATAIPSNGVVLSGHGAARGWLLINARPGAVVTLPGATPTPTPTATSTGTPSVGTRVTVGSASFPLSGTNIQRAADALVLFTPIAGASTPTNIYGAEAVVVGGLVTVLLDRQSTGAGATAIPSNGVVLSGHGTARDWLLATARPGAIVTFPGASPTPTPTTSAAPTASPTVSTQAAVGASTFPLSGTDVHRAADTLVLFTPAAGPSTTTNIYGAEAVVVGGLITALLDRQSTGAGATAIPSNGVVLSGHGTARDWLLANARVGAAVTLSGTTATPTGPTFTSAPTATTPAPTTTTPSSAVVKVMPMGDSITQVGGVAMGFKGYLLDKLLASGSRVDYVGSQVATGPTGLKDRDHEGHSGWQNSNFQPTAAGYVVTYQPQVLLYHVGTNDIWSNIEPSLAISRLRDVLTKVYAARPGTHVVLAKIVRLNVGKDAQWQQYNAAIPAVVSDFAAQGRRITLADLSATITLADLQGDGVHLTDGGHRKMADAFYPTVKAAVDSAR